MLHSTDFLNGIKQSIKYSSHYENTQIFHPALWSHLQMNRVTGLVGRSPRFVRDQPVYTIASSVAQQLTLSHREGPALPTLTINGEFLAERAFVKLQMITSKKVISQKCYLITGGAMNEIKRH